MTRLSTGSEPAFQLVCGFSTSEVARRGDPETMCNYYPFPYNRMLHEIARPVIGVSTTCGKTLQV